MKLDNSFNKMSPTHLDSHAFLNNLEMSPEFKLVSSCSWTPDKHYSLKQQQIIDALLGSYLDWDAVTSLLLRHGVVGQFCVVMGQRDWVNVPASVKVRLKVFRYNLVIGGLKQVAELKRIGKRFSDAHIDLIPLKGVALSQELYGDPLIRSTVDLDILVRPEDVEKAERLLIQSGYSHEIDFQTYGVKQKLHIVDTLHHHEYINDATAVHIELHWRSYLWPKEQVAALWDTSRDLPWLQVGMRQLSTEENILFLADHGARHNWPCLKWLSDLAMLMGPLSEESWLSVYNRAAFFDLQRVLIHTAVLLEMFYGIVPPQSIKRLIASDAIARKLAYNVASELVASPEELVIRKKRFAGIRMAFRLKQLKPATPSVLLVRGLLITHADFKELSLPDSFFWLYIPLRLWFALKRHFRNSSS